MKAKPWTKAERRALDFAFSSLLRRAEKITVKRLGERVAQLKDGESIVLEREGNLAEEARKIRNGLYGIKACILVRCMVKVVDGKIVITRVGTWPTLGAF
ncbi:MAG: hypothetical protein DMG32_07245 [Acidobacteria bacterium]|nr:MAG: hypothetical protein DMG32_07245 [Acidobacteriota bacterium]